MIIISQDGQKIITRLDSKEVSSEGKGNHHGD